MAVKRLCEPACRFFTWRIRTKVNDYVASNTAHGMTWICLTVICHALFIDRVLANCYPLLSDYASTELLDRPTHS